MRLYNIVLESMQDNEPVLDSITCSKISMMEPIKDNEKEDITIIENFYLLILCYYLQNNDTVKDTVKDTGKDTVKDIVKDTVKDTVKDIVYSGKILNKTYTT